MASATIRRLRLVLGVFAGFAAFGAVACEPFSGTNSYPPAGVYCLTGDVVGGGFHFYDNTTLDCQGHKIKDPPATAGIAVDAQGDNIVVKNCVFEGFAYPVRFINATNYLIENNQFLDSTERAIFAVGSQGRIAGNTIRNRAPREPWWTAIEAAGIVDIIGNTVIGGNNPAGIPWGGIIVQRGGGVIAQNMVRGASIDGDVDFTGIGLLFYRNVVVGIPGEGGEGLICNGSPSLQNVVVGFDIPYFDCSQVVYPAQVGLKAGSRLGRRSSR